MATRKKTSSKRGARKKTAAAGSRKKAAARKSTAKPRTKAAAKSAKPTVKAKAKTAKAKPARTERKPAAPKRSPAQILAEQIVAATTATPPSLELKALYAEDCVSHEPRSDPSVGFEGLEEKAKLWSDMQKRSTWNPRHVTTDGDTILIVWDAEVELRDGRTLAFEEVAIHRTADGKIVEEWYYYDPAVFEPPPVVEDDTDAPPPRPPRPRSAARPVETTGTPPVDPIDL